MLDIWWYLGCGGNANNFQTIEECNKKCGSDTASQDYEYLQYGIGDYAGKIKKNWLHENFERKELPNFDVQLNIKQKF